MKTKTLALLLAIATSVLMASCGGGKSGTASAGGTQTPATQPSGPLVGSTKFTVRGVVSDGQVVAGARISAYGGDGKACGSANADSSGAYTLSSSCSFPLVLFGDVPDANETLPMPDSVVGEGRQYFAFISEITSDGQSFTANITPLTKALTLLVLAREPAPGVANPAALLSADRKQSATAKMKTVTDAIITQMGNVPAETLDDSMTPGSALGGLAAMAPITFERVASTKQTIMRFNVVTEHRPVALVITDGATIDAAAIDTGLGMALADLDKTRMTAGLATVISVKASMAKTIGDLPGMLDSCFLHNGTRTMDALLDTPPGWTPASGSAIENMAVRRIDTYVDQNNETLELRNSGAATLVYASFDFRNIHGMKQRAYTWAISPGAQDVNGCGSSGTGWRVLGNQRKLYSRINTYALHSVMFSQQFGTRLDKAGTGVEEFLSDATNGAPMKMALVSGPGIKSDGVVFVRLDGAFLTSTATLEVIRKSWNSAPKDPDAATLKTVADLTQDTRSIVMTDPQVRTVADGYYDGQNAYTIRVFQNYQDLFPTYTYVDVLPKRPYLNSELPVTYFHSIGVNTDRLVTSLQTLVPVDVNWSLPLDIRGQAMKPSKAWLSRMNCIAKTTWPKCAKRSQQYNEYDLAMTYFSDPAVGAASLTPESFPVAAGQEPTTFRGMARVEVIDSLNRPIETQWGMDYQR